MRAAIAILQSDPNTGRNKPIIFIIDTSPTIGDGVQLLKKAIERAFLASLRTIRVTYVGIGLSFDA